ncbi:MAG: DUF475 domain-containing protein [Syntrophobacteraceae bacterium]|jgi:hypothetical protein|nr:DUF475 domain-containing protein [Syntrophobacteraceae bacterium]
MDITSAILTIAGLAVFESITSIDNAIINAEILATMGIRARKWFLTWGILIAVFGVHVPEWLAPVATLVIVGYFLLKSLKQAKTASS